MIDRKAIADVSSASGATALLLGNHNQAHSLPVASPVSLYAADPKRGIRPGLMQASVFTTAGRSAEPSDESALSCSPRFAFKRSAALLTHKDECGNEFVVGRSVPDWRSGVLLWRAPDSVQARHVLNSKTLTRTKPLPAHQRLGNQNCLSARLAAFWFSSVGTHSPIIPLFIGSGTTGAVASRLGRRWVGCDLTYFDISKRRTAQRGLTLEVANA